MICKKTSILPTPTQNPPIETYQMQCGGIEFENTQINDTIL